MPGHRAGSHRRTVSPYLPAASSDAFKGISVFRGVLVSLGPSPAVGNIVSGVMLTYMRPYQIGDYLRIAQTEGAVVERSLLLTRLRTPQNEIVTIPNAQVLSPGRW
ncbi:mechanosensitive ion channel domain-containing protein [Frateuria defendens]|uniref:mechanosensitive ion channel domain-containing protein n=1 Tax=Frateuria defendens TaxID=2219559 RepID=UPI00066FDD25|nr:mechanosensitive ion channel domain-containing protein [Frateuria defendens]